MNDTAINLISALIISCVITCMAVLKRPAAKALVYSLPVPLTVALLATSNKVDSFTIMGILLANVFIWGVFFLYEKMKWPIL